MPTVRLSSWTSARWREHVHRAETQRPCGARTRTTVVHAIDPSQQSRLAATGCADAGGNAPPVDRQRDVGQCASLAKPTAELADLHLDFELWIRVTHGSATIPGSGQAYPAQIRHTRSRSGLHTTDPNLVRRAVELKANPSSHSVQRPQPEQEDQDPRGPPTAETRALAAESNRRSGAAES